jgi:hypothetical protein
MVKIKEVTLNLGFVSVTFGEDELDHTLASLVDEMRTITSGLTVPERDVLRRIMGAPPGIKVTDVFSDFQRDTPAHNTLRQLRDAQFVRPAEGGQWTRDKHIAIKPFGRLMWEKIGEAKLFSRQP